MVKTASRNTLYNMSLGQLNERIHRLQKEGGTVFKQRTQTSHRTSPKTYEQLSQRYKKIQAEIKKTTNIKTVTKNAWNRKRIMRKRKQLRKRK
jgi:hypothetical protein